MQTILNKEEEMVALLKQGDKAGYDILMANYGGVLFGVISRMMMGEEEIAKDLLQETLIKIWKNISQYHESKGKIYTWMLNIARNHTIDYQRSKNYRQQAMNQSLEDYIHSVSERMGAVQMKTDGIGLIKILDVLKKDQRELIDMVYFRGYTQEEAAKVLSIPSGTVKTRIRSALIHLRQHLKTDINI